MYKRDLIVLSDLRDQTDLIKCVRSEGAPYFSLYNSNRTLFDIGSSLTEMRVLCAVISGDKSILVRRKRIKLSTLCGGK
jgi:hypothetical protein